MPPHRAISHPPPHEPPTPRPHGHTFPGVIGRVVPTVSRLSRPPCRRKSAPVVLSSLWPRLFSNASSSPRLGRMATSSACLSSAAISPTRKNLLAACLPASSRRTLPSSMSCPTPSSSPCSPPISAAAPRPAARAAITLSKISSSKNPRTAGLSFPPRHPRPDAAPHERINP